MRNRATRNGFVTIQFVLATGLCLVVFVMLVNFVVFLYARGVVRAAVDEGARTGGRAGADLAQCERRADDVLSDLVSGMKAGIAVECREENGAVLSRAEVTLRGWLPPLTPDWTFTLTGRSLGEGAE